MSVLGSILNAGAATIKITKIKKKTHTQPALSEAYILERGDDH